MSIVIKIGICYRDSIHEEFIDKLIEYVDFLELMPDITGYKETKRLLKICKDKNIDIGIHCLKSSLGSKEGIYRPAIEQYAFYSEYVEAAYYSDHVAYSHMHDVYLSKVFPVEYDMENILIMRRNLEIVSSFFSNQILLENITQNKLSNKGQLNEGRFFRELLKNANSRIKILFDVTNAYVTALNNNYAFEEYVSEYPFEKIECIHVSGFERDNEGVLRDTHSNSLNEEILISTEWILQRTNPKYILVERDFNVQCIDDVLEDIYKLRRIVHKR
ncbi:hypothetical protein LH47_00571 [Anoxybacillus thermarum]|uniref:DUF692 domain-containing protein n=1 Tax=Anoxybacillus thermarum TaxID=404937 RepID=A0A0D0RUP2_9BACL|nr:hypothetical protein LH47_00571 [Anoxybacillus thermarum]